MSIEEVVDGGIGSDERQAVEGFKAFVTQAAFFSQAMDAQGGFVDLLQGQTRFDAFRGLAGPAAEQVPGAQDEVFGDEQPKADKGATDLVGQVLAPSSFEADGVGGVRQLALLGTLGLNAGWRGWRHVEFFFEDHTGGECVRRY